MSGAPKRSHEESGHSSSSKYPHEDSSAYPKLSSTVTTEYHPPYEMNQDARIPKIPRTESRDVDRRSPLHSIYRAPSASNDSHVDHTPVSENRLESRDSKDSRDHRFENRDTKTEIRELYGEVRRDSQNAKVEKDVRYETRGDDSKEIKYDRDSFNDVKSDVKVGKDAYGVSSSHLNWKESKEYHRGKRYSDAPPGSTEPWILRGNSQGHAEVGKEGSTTEERDHVEAHEAVGENKFDSKGEDKFKDKDRKRKDVKHRDWGERDKERSDRRSTMQVANSGNECKEPAKEERDAERWERERKDPAKDKDRLKERERDHTKKDSWNGVDKESSHSEKDLGDGSNIVPEQENLVSEKKQKAADKESRDRRKERDGDVDVDKPEKRSRGYDKESDDGCADGEGVPEREREVYNYGVQQRKRMQRSRGSPQVANREPRFRTRIQDNEGCVNISGQNKVHINLTKPVVLFSHNFFFLKHALMFCNFLMIDSAFPMIHFKESFILKS